MARLLARELTEAMAAQIEAGAANLELHAAARARRPPSSERAPGHLQESCQPPSRGAAIGTRTGRRAGAPVRVTGVGKSCPKRWLQTQAPSKHNGEEVGSITEVPAAPFFASFSQEAPGGQGLPRGPRTGSRARPCPRAPPPLAGAPPAPAPNDMAAAGPSGRDREGAGGDLQQKI